MADKMYYLETSAVYALPNQIFKSMDKEKTFTSWFTVQEIVTGVDKKSYERRKRALNKILENGIKVEKFTPVMRWLIPFGIDVQDTSVDVFNNMNNEKENVIRYASALRNSNSYDDFISEADVIKGSYEEMKAETNDIKKRINEKTHEVIRANYKVMKDNQGKKIDIDINKMFFPVDEEGETERTYEFEKRWLGNVLPMFGFVASEEDISEMAKKHKSELVATFWGESAYMFYRSKNCETPERNDAFDISHLVYLIDENCVMVTNDDIYRKITMNSQRIDVGDFKGMFDETD